MSCLRFGNELMLEFHGRLDLEGDIGWRNIGVAQQETKRFMPAKNDSLSRFFDKQRRHLASAKFSFGNVFDSFFALVYSVSELGFPLWNRTLIEEGGDLGTAQVAA